MGIFTAPGLYFKQNITAFVSFAVAIVGAMMPIWLGALLLFGYNQWKGWSIFWEGGEFYLYSAAFSTQAIYLLLNYIITTGDRKNWKAILLIAFSIFVMLVSAALYSSAVTSSITSEASLNQNFLTLSSMILLVMSLLFVFGAEVYNGKKAPDVAEEYADDVEKMKGEL